VLVCNIHIGISPLFLTANFSSVLVMSQVPHQPGQAVFKAIASEGIDWKPFAVFPPSARLAVVVGQPSEKGPYTIRVKVPGGVDAA
jgi:hypothetical protein